MVGDHVGVQAPMRSDLLRFAASLLEVAAQELTKTPELLTMTTEYEFTVNANYPSRLEE